MGRKGYKRGWFTSRHYEYDFNAAAKVGRTLDVEVWQQAYLENLWNLVRGGQLVWAVSEFHDKDPKVDETTGQVCVEAGKVVLKGIHVHTETYASNTISQSQIIQWLGLSRPENAIGWSGVKHRTRWALYLTHSNPKDRADGKFEYDVSTVIVMNPHVADPVGWYRQLRAGKLPEDKAATDSARDEFLWVHAQAIGDGLETADDAVRLARTDSEVAKKLELGMDQSFWLRARNVFDKAADEFRRDCVHYYESHNRCLETVYVQAAGGLRKTDIARMRAERKLAAAGCRLGYQTIAAKGGGGLTFDPAGNYAGQPVAIANEFSLGAMGLDMFKDMFDPLHVPVVNSRNADKVWFPQQVILTTSNDLEEQIATLFLAWARKQRKKGAEVQGSGDDGKMTSAEWEAFYLSRPDMADQIRQVRRRIPVLVTFEKPCEDMDLGGKPYLVRVAIREDERNACVLRLGEADTPAELGIDEPSLLMDMRCAGEYERQVEVGAGLGRGYMVTVRRHVIETDNGDHEDLTIDRSEARMLRPLDPAMRTNIFDRRTGGLWCDGEDAGAFTTTHMVAYDPACDADLAAVDAAVDEAFALYYATNGLSVTPASVPLVPPLAQWRQAENDASAALSQGVAGLVIDRQKRDA